MTYRERREARAERLRDWADSAEKKADAAHERVHEIADQIPFGQPILVGHHSEGRHRRDQARIESGMRESIDQSRKAQRHEERASNIERQLRESVYDDDEDAVEQLTQRIARREATREMLKRFNATCRRGAPDYSLLTEKWQRELESTARVAPYSLTKGGGFPTYVLSNLGANIRRDQQRLERLKRDRADAEAGVQSRPRQMLARFSSTCDACGEGIEKGEVILYFKRERRAIHDRCGKES